MKTLKSPIIKRLLPWLIAALIIGFLFWRIDYVKFIESLEMAEISIYIPLIILFIFIWFFVETFNVQKLYQYFGHHVSYRTMLSIRGTTFLLMIINYGLGAGAIAMYLKKLIGVSLLRSTGILFYYMVVESAGIAFMAAAGFLLAGDSSGVQEWVFYLASGLFLFYNIEIIVLKYIPALGFLKRFVNSSILMPVRESTFSVYVKIFFQRMGYFMTFVIFFYFTVRAFHMDIPFMTLTALVPIIFFVGNLPITPFGLGTIQAAMLYFFKDYGTPPNIFAMSLVYTVSLMIFRAMIGLYYLKTAAGFLTDTGKNIDNIISGSGTYNNNSI
ncbi:MAG TPA: lysylphosphatidylglycerol synthase domain-containing protein [Spirochaetota bacterium]|nr:lysylphosphatidylglycerol synthase domain-containing protein [Spirochaetota bacterium]